MNRRRNVLALLAVVVLGLFAWRFLAGGERGAVERPENPRADAERPDGTSAARPALATPERVERAPASSESAPSPDPVHAPAVEPVVAMWVRVLDSRTGSPVAGARIERAAGEGGGTESDAEGFAALAFPEDATLPEFGSFSTSFTARGFARVHAEGYGLAEFRLDKGHERKESALELRLDRSGAIAVLLTRRSDLSEGAYELRATLLALDLVENATLLGPMDMQTLHFQAPCDAGGNVRLDDLPASAALTVNVIRGKELVRKLPEPVTLEPGETRELTIDLGAACQITGTVRDGQEAAVAGLDVWLGASSLGQNAQFYPWEEKDMVARTRTDAAGRFDLGEVPAGKYRVGPNPGPFRGPREGALAGVVGVNQPVEVLATDSTKVIELRVDRDLYVDGMVLAPNETTLTEGGCTVSCGRSTSFQTSTTTKEDGSFTLGPMPAGRHVLVAESGSFLESLPVEAEAGATGVVLTLRQGAGVAGKVVAAPGGPGVRATLILSVQPAKTIRTHTDETGSFHFPGLMPGRISLAASSADGLIGVRSWDLATGAQLTDQEVVLVPGAKLLVRTATAAKLVWVAVMQDGILVANPDVQRDGTARGTVPTGELTLRVHLKDPRETLEQTIRVTAGEQREVLIEP